ncbi:MAG: SpoIID/LytB domain-containing protein, partial [Anaerovorax sp.]
SSPMEAIKAQAVAARSFAGASVGAHNSNGFDLCATTHCQMYKGVAGETVNTNKATDETRGEMIYSEGKPVNAFYAKNAGGYTQNSEDVWYATLPYLRSVKDIYAPDYLWTATMTFSQLKARLEATGYRPGEIKSVSVKKRSEAGAVYTLEIVGSDGIVALQKDSIRTVLGGSTIKSLMFHFVDSTLSEGTESVTYVVSSSGTKTKVSTGAIYVTNGTTTVKWKDSPVASGGKGEIIETVTSGVLNIEGNGYGHGVGMQQDGAIAMGKQGFTYKDILKFYYTGVEVK